MSNKIETIEQRAKKLFPLNINDNLEDVNEADRNIWIFGANWQKEQDEAKYKALLDSHNELLNGIKEINEVSNGIGVLNQTWLREFCQELINKSKNI